MCAAGRCRESTSALAPHTLETTDSRPYRNDRRDPRPLFGSPLQDTFSWQRLELKPSTSVQNGSRTADDRRRRCSAIDDLSYPPNPKIAEVLGLVCCGLSANDALENIHSINAFGQWSVRYLTPEALYTEYADTQNDNGSAAPWPRGAIMDTLIQTLTPSSRGSAAFDIFSVFRDSYPLPGGLESPWSEYDYVIVGAGSSGSVLASRLTEDRGVDVLALEVGLPENLLTDVPVISSYFQRTGYTWPYRMELQPDVCRGMEFRRCFWPRGRAVGGTSVINYMLYTRGRPEDWDRIAADGNYGWSYGDVLPYYIKLEKTNLRYDSGDQYKGYKGKVSIENPPFRTRLVEAFLQAGRLLGNPTVDYNSPNEIGLGYAQLTTRQGHRLSAAKAYLHPHKNRKNLHILPESRATKIMIDPVTREATGVEFVRYGNKYVVKARREVIISAGPIESPKLLMLSGIGPEDHLTSMGIPVIQNLNVGRTLYDHISFDGVIFTLNTSNISIMEQREANLRNILRWLQFGDGVLASPGGVEGLGYIKTPVPYEPDVLVDIELISIAGSLASDGGGAIRKGMMIRDDIFNAAFGPLVNKETWSVFPLLLYPKSKGYLELKDRNPFSHPKIVGNYLSHPRDVATIIAAVRHIIEMGLSPPFQQYGAKLHEPDFPECRNLIFNSDEYWECAIRQITSTEHHQVGTCKMGPSTDPDAVVDPELRVYGMKNLRVVDSSIIPRQTVAHTNGPALMIAEKAADIIKRSWM
ncbi:Glucose dehydrogenase [Eumeta japonica]|uniref:Glucose dehydrogenase n=1 Tax=Eumeta variegata TaxID=151549 RepID=A0A4C1ZML1_EUMVA|nr:Glucose dehydrogenase [Eumeta japonica]